MGHSINLDVADAVTPGMLPSAYMRLARPELFSDSGGNSAFRLEPAVLDHHLETLTSRNQTQAFELFCRDLCGRIICPNLKPATGPEGGGDSKADTETISVADELTTLHYVGEPGAGAERWAFAFSAKKDWKSKVRSDVDGLAATGRGYSRVICVTSRYAPAKARSALEDELKTAHGFRVEIHDRTWIMKAVVEDGNADLAVDRLGVGERVTDHRPGPEDYRRSGQLAALDLSLADPTGYERRETERVEDALSAALLSRDLERPRLETDGRFDRAIRLADRFGTARQQVEARYERLWAAYYWHDDFDLLNEAFDAVASRVYRSEDAETHELVANLVQNLLNAVMLGHRSAEAVDLERRRDALVARLEGLAADRHRPNNALEAQTTLLFTEASRIIQHRRWPELAALWPRFSATIAKADGLAEYRVQRLEPIVELFGRKAGRDDGYQQLIEDLATFVAKRAGDARGGLIRLKRALQLDIEEDRLEIIRLLGRATRELAQREHLESQVEATYTLAVAYRGAGLMWAARAAALFSVATVFAEAERESGPPASIVAALMLLGWIDAELNLLPELLDVVRLIKGCQSAFALDEEPTARLEQRLTDMDGVLAASLLHTTLEERAKLERLPDILNALDLNASAVALLYALGHRKLLDTPAGEAGTEWDTLLARWAEQLPADIRARPCLLNVGPSQIQTTRVAGMAIQVRTSGSVVSIVTGQTLLTMIEAVFATILEAGLAAHVETFQIEIVEQADIVKPSFTIDDMAMRARLTWPLGIPPNDPALEGAAHDAFFESTLQLALTTCLVNDPVAVFDKLFTREALGERMGAALASVNSRTRAFNSPLSTIETWDEMGGAAYPLHYDQVVRMPSVAGGAAEDADAPVEYLSKWMRDHRLVEVRSIIDLPVWERADWIGLMLGAGPPGVLPVLGLHFGDEELGKQIFNRWRERFGDEDREAAIHISIIRELPGHPAAHYGAMLSPGISCSSSANTTIISTRLKVLEPETDLNLRRFLDGYAREQAYRLVPAVWGPEGMPVLATELTIIKRDLVVTRFDDIQEGEIESLARRLLRQADANPG